jgi:hypothetical protein
MELPRCSTPLSLSLSLRVVACPTDVLPTHAKPRDPTGHRSPTCRMSRVAHSSPPHLHTPPSCLTVSQPDDHVQEEKPDLKDQGRQAGQKVAAHTHTHTPMYVLHLHVAVGVAPTTYRNSPAAVVIVVVHLDNLYRNSVIGYRIKLLEPATLSPANPRSCPIVMSLSHTHTYTHTHTHALSLSHSHSLTLSLSLVKWYMHGYGAYCRRHRSQGKSPSRFSGITFIV